MDSSSPPPPGGSLSNYLCGDRSLFEVDRRIFWNVSSHGRGLPVVSGYCEPAALVGVFGLLFEKTPISGYSLTLVSGVVYLWFQNTANPGFFATGPRKRSRPPTMLQTFKTRRGLPVILECRERVTIIEIAHLQPISKLWLVNPTPTEISLFLMRRPRPHPNPKSHPQPQRPVGYLLTERQNWRKPAQCAAANVLSCSISITNCSLVMDRSIFRLERLGVSWPLFGSGCGGREDSSIVCAEVFLHWPRLSFRGLGGEESPSTHCWLIRFSVISLPCLCVERAAKGDSVESIASTEAH